MKRSQIVPYLIILILLILLIFREFNRGGGSIPVDNEKARAHIVSMKTAADYTKAFHAAEKELKAQLKDSTFLNRQFNLPKCEMFNRDAIAALLNKEGSKGVRIYLGLNEKKEVCFVLVPVTDKGTDLRGKLVADKSFRIPGISSAMAQLTDEEAIERGQRCPYVCDLTSPLTTPVP